MSDKEGSPYHSGGSRSPSRDRSPASDKRSASRSISRSRSLSRSRSMQRHGGDSRSRSRSLSGGRRRYVSRSRSRSPHYKRRRHSRYSRSRSRSYSPYYKRGYSPSYGYSDKFDRHSDRDRYRSSRRGRSRSVSPMSNRRRHAGNREDPQTSKCVGVFGLSLYTQERDLRDIFGRYGPIDDIQVVYDHQTGRSRGFAFIYYRNLDDAVEAKEQAPGTEVDGRRIRVDYSITERAHTPTPGIYLGKPSSSSGGHKSDYSRRSASPYSRGKRGYSYSRSRSRSYSPRRY